jgi:hypothetical protein
MTVWVVSGACRGVGKTWLAQRLSQILPQAVCAKIGHNPRKQGRAGDYFTSVGGFLGFLESLRGCRHCVVESNRLALRGYGDVVVFIDAPRDARGVRKDAPTLRARAGIVIERNPQVVVWRRVVGPAVGDPSTADAVCALFQQQVRFISRA